MSRFAGFLAFNDTEAHHAPSRRLQVVCELSILIPLNGALKSPLMGIISRRVALFGEITSFSATGAVCVLCSFFNQPGFI
jgi:hypothetical protein